MTTIAVSGPALRVRRSALLSELGEAAEEIERASTHSEMERDPESFKRPLVRLDQIRAALELLGWSEAEPEAERRLALAPHRASIVAALQARLEVEREYAEGDEDGTGAARQRSNAREQVALIEGLLAQLAGPGR
jgi:hypothetical protein